MDTFLILVSVVASVLTSTAAQSGCLVRPMERLENVDAACERDIGGCSGDPCTLCHDQSPKCCSPIYERVNTTCPARMLEYSKVKKCDCLPCTTPQVFISGRVGGECTSYCDFLITVGGVTHRADMNGDYSFYTDKPENGRVVFTVTDDQNGAYFEQIKVVTTAQEIQSYNNIFVYMVQKPTPPDSFDPTIRNVLTKGTTGDFSIVFPPGSVTYPDGTPYTSANVSASINFIDPSSSSPSSIPAELITGENPAGILSSSGMLQVDLTDDSGNPLIANGVEVYLDTNTLGQGEIDGIGIWTVNPQTGFWELLTDMTITATDPNTRRRKKRGGSFVTASFDITSASRIYNLDALMWPYCHMKVRLFFDVGGTLVPASQIPVYSLYGRNNDTWTNFLQRISGAHGICVSVPCGTVGHDVRLVRVSVPGFTVLGASMPVADQTRLSYEGFGEQFLIIIPDNDTVATANGPIYTSYTTCFSAPTTDNYFQMKSNFPNDEESNVLPMDENDVGTLPVDLYAWWPNLNDFEACYIKVDFTIAGGKGQEFPELLNPIRVKVISRGGTHSVTMGNDYGFRISQTIGNFACVEYKCPAILTDGEFDRTEIKVIPDTNLTFTLDYINVNLYNSTERMDAAAQYGNADFTYLAPLNNNTGVYMASAAHPLTAKANARGLCFSGVGALEFTDDSGQFSGEFSGDRPALGQ